MLTTYPPQKTFSGTIVHIVGYRFQLKVRTAAIHDTLVKEDTKLVRKNGAPMEYKEILLGDKVQVIGQLWEDGSVTASKVLNKSLYIHNSTITGKVKSVDTFKQTFTVQGPKGQHTVQADSYTIFKLNGIPGSIKDIALGASVKIKGAWERSVANIQARQVDIKIRLVKIEVTGQVVGKNNNFLTVTAHNVIYAVDAGTAKLLNKSRKVITLNELTVGGNVKVTGKHIPENVNVTASIIKEL